MKDPKKRIRELAGKDRDQWIEIRRHLHRHPELSFQEHKTARYISRIMKGWKISHKTIATTGVLAEIKGRNPGSKLIVIRGDIDALPIQEESGLEFASENPGVMHACGHDIHSTCVLGAARILDQLRDEFKGTVKFVFQPGEEKLPGGAKLVLKTGELDKPEPDGMIGQHVFPELSVGKVGFRSGKYMASADEIYIKIKGPGGHGALPDQTCDVIYTAAELIQSLQKLVSRIIPASIPSVLTFGKIIGMGATNVIPREVLLEGTFRTMDEPWRGRVHKKIVEISQGVAEMNGARVEVEIRKGYPAVINHPGITQSMKDAAVEFLGRENVVDLDVRMTSEDFAFYSQRFNTCFYRLGIHGDEGKITKLHAPDFIADESCIETGIGLMSYMAFRFLNEGGKK